MMIPSVSISGPWHIDAVPVSLIRAMEYQSLGEAKEVHETLGRRVVVDAIISRRKYPT